MPPQKYGNLGKLHLTRRSSTQNAYRPVTPGVWLCRLPARPFKAGELFLPQALCLLGLALAMKTKSSFIRPLVLTSAFAIAVGGTASAGISDITVFTTADLDISGSLSTTEFNTTLDAGLSVRAQARTFRRADANRNGDIQLNEFLLFRGALDPANRLERSFFLGDASIDGSLTFDEFTNTYRARLSLVKVRRNFLRADVNADTTVTMSEWLSFRRGETPPLSGYTIFELADFDANAQITLTEFGYWLPRTAAQAKVEARFTRFDLNADGILTTDEWNPGVRQ